MMPVHNHKSRQNLPQFSLDWQSLYAPVRMAEFYSVLGLNTGLLW